MLLTSVTDHASIPRSNFILQSRQNAQPSIWNSCSKGFIEGETDIFLLQSSHLIIQSPPYADIHN